MANLLKAVKFLSKEIADFYCFFWRTKKRERSVVFYAEHKDYYPYFEGLIKELIGKYDRTLCYVTSDPYDTILQNSKSKIETFYFNKLLPFFMAFVDCRVFIMTLTDLNQFHLKRSINPVHYVYVFHSLVSTHMVYKYGAFDHYDSILCCGPHHIEEIRKYENQYGLLPKNLIEAGYYRLERVYEAYQKYHIEKTFSDTKGTVLIAPSWGDYNILESCGMRLVELLLESGYKVIVRPHPETLRHFPKSITFFATKFGNNPNFTLETSVATDDSLLRADVLVSDYSGIVLEYAFGTERPVLFLDVPAKIRNQKFEELGVQPLELSVRSEIGIVIPPEKLEDVPRAVSNLMLNRETYRKRIIELRKQYVYAFGHSSEIGAKYIINISMGENH